MVAFLANKDLHKGLISAAAECLKYWYIWLL